MLHNSHPDQFHRQCLVTIRAYNATLNYRLLLTWFCIQYLLTFELLQTVTDLNRNVIPGICSKLSSHVLFILLKLLSIVQSLLHQTVPQ